MCGICQPSVTRARKPGQLAPVLELTMLVAGRTGRYPRVAARWLLRYLEEDPEATIEKAALRSP